MHSRKESSEEQREREVLFDQLYLYQLFESNREHHGHVHVYMLLGS